MNRGDRPIGDWGQAYQDIASRAKHVPMSNFFRFYLHLLFLLTAADDCEM